MIIKVTIPGKNVSRYAFLSCFNMGFRSVRSNWSAADGGGIFSSSQINKSKGNAKTRPAKKGSQNSEMANCNCKKPVTVFTKPDAKIKLTESAAPIKSEALRP